MTKSYGHINHALPWEEVLRRRARFANCLYLKLGFKNLNIRWPNERVVDFVYKEKPKDATTTAIGSIIITPAGIIIAVEGWESVKILTAIKTVTEEVFSDPLP